MDIKNTGPIGIFDSGIGGVSVMHQIREQMPYEDLAYVADTAYLPYGDKSSAFVAERSISIAEFLVNQGAKALVVACNTATAAAVRDLRERYKLPIIGMEPGLKPAAEKTTSGTVGVMATSGTLNSSKFDNLNAQFGKNIRVIAQACPGLVEIAESGRIGSDSARELIAMYVSDLVDKGADTIVLGCTHYPVFEPLIRKIAGDEIDIIDTGRAVAREVARRLDNEKLMNRKRRPGTVVFWSSDPNSKVRVALSSLWRHEKIQLNSLPPEYCDREKTIPSEFR